MKIEQAVRDHVATIFEPLKKKAAAEIVPGFCIMTVNGVLCTHTPKRRGLCGSCIWQERA